MAAPYRYTYLREELLQAAFQHFDTRGRGEITAEDLQISLVGASSKDPQLATALVKSIDMDHDGAIDFAEFKQMMLQGNNNNNGSGDTVR